MATYNLQALNMIAARIWAELITATMIVCKGTQKILTDSLVLLMQIVQCLQTIQDLLSGWCGGHWGKKHQMYVVTGMKQGSGNTGRTMKRASD